MISWVIVTKNSLWKHQEETGNGVKHANVGALWRKRKSVINHKQSEREIQKLIRLASGCNAPRGPDRRCSPSDTGKLSTRGTFAD